MTRAAASVLLAAAACGGAAHPAPEPGPPHVATASSPLSQVAWLAGSWRSEIFDSHWQEVAGAFYGVSLPRDPEDGFEVNVIDDSDAEGQPSELTLLSIEVDDEGTHASHFTLAHATPDEISFADHDAGTVKFTRTARGWRGDFAPPEGVAIGFDTRPIELESGAALEAADRAFDADTAHDGADGWVRHFDEHGAMWRGQLVAGLDPIRGAIAKTLAHGTLRWAPVASGARGDFGFTLGTGTFTPTSGAPAHVSYCTIWKRQPDGTWKVLFDL